MANTFNNARGALAVAVSSALLLLFTLAASKSPQGLSAASFAPQENGSDQPGPPRSPGATDLDIATTQSTSNLRTNIDRLINETGLRTARWGIFVMSLRDGRVLYKRDADKAFTPASNMKLYTTAVALDQLGSDYRWRTSIFAKAEPDSNGVISGDLVFYGRGAPDLSSTVERGDRRPSMDQLADDLHRRGVRRISGDIIGDESYFRGEPLGDGWLWNDVQWYFGAEVSALSVNDNAVNFTITPANRADGAAAIVVKPETGYIQIENDLETVERAAQPTLGITRGLSDNNVRVWGNSPVDGSGVRVHLSVHRPALWAAKLLADAIRRRGITIDGTERMSDAREPKKARAAAPEGFVELASTTSETLGKIVRITNKESVNLYAELILRTLGKERGSSAVVPDKNEMMTRGDDEAGTAVISQWLERRGISPSLLALHDGSGLSRLNLVTPETTGRLLATMAERPSAAVFRDSLPIAGRDGTLKFRLRSVGAARVMAKTGSLTYVSSLSGYATTADDEVFAFSIICNDAGPDGRSNRTIDSIVALLTSYRESSR